jgi:hypothetical protein
MTSSTSEVSNGNVSALVWVKIEEQNKKLALSFPGMCFCPSFKINTDPRSENEYRDDFHSDVAESHCFQDVRSAED